MVTVYESNRAAGKTIDELFDLNEEDDYDYLAALMDDEFFTVACYHYQSLELYAPDGNQHDRDARDAMERSVREHAQRVQGEIDA